MENNKVYYKITIRNASFKYRPNFSGRNGARDLTVVIEDPEEAARLKADGWNIKPEEITLPGQEYFLPIEVRWIPGYPDLDPVINRVKPNGSIQEITESMVSMLDKVDIKTMDIRIRPKNWEDNNGNHRVKAYLDEMVVVFDDESLIARYYEAEPEE